MFTGSGTMLYMQLIVVCALALLQTSMTVGEEVVRCENGGTAIGAVRCVCADSFVGQFCETPAPLMTPRWINFATSATKSQSYAGAGVTDCYGFTYEAGWTSTPFTAVSPAINGARDSYIRRIDPSGNVNWTVMHPATAFNDLITAIVADPSGTFVYTAAAVSTSAIDTRVSKVSAASGEIIWSQMVGDPSNSDYPWGLTLGESGDIFVSGWTSSSVFYGWPLVGGADSFIVRLNESNGAFLNATRFGGVNYELFGFLTRDGPFLYFAGHSTNYPGGTIIFDGAVAHGGSADWFIVKLFASNFTRITVTVIGQTGNDRPGAIAVDPISHWVYVCGNITLVDWNRQPLPSGYANIGVAIIHPNGTALTTRQFTGVGNAQATAIATPNDGTIVVAGATRFRFGQNSITSNTDTTGMFGRSDMYLLRLNATTLDFISVHFFGGPYV